LISRFDREKVLTALREAWCVVCCTGQAGALAVDEYIDIVRDGKQLMVNMGVEDEWGKNISQSRVLNNKQPLNFILHEPTLLRYIDPTMALHNHGAVELMQKTFTADLHRIAPEVHDFYWQIVEKNGLIADELYEAGL
jgi:adenosylhomocysteinase